MKIAELLAQWFGLTAAQLVNVLLKLKETAPDLADKIDWILMRLDMSATVENLGQVGAMLLAEFSDVAQLKFRGEQHPSDLA
jgi:hypothetical protein